jgi:glycosyltransferase involved in cell wall biosynthesis
MSLPAVTIVVPAYNRAGGLLEQTLDSILGQEYSDLEVIALDDGSTDETPEVLERYANRWPHRLRTGRHENMGQARTLEVGFEMARGELVGYLSADDLLRPGAVTALAATLAEENDAVVAYPSWDVIDAAGTVVNRIDPIPYSLAESVRLQDTIVGPGALIRRDALRSAGCWNPDYRWLADLEHWWRLAAVGGFVHVPRFLACWRNHEGAATVADAGRAMAAERLHLLDDLYERSPAGLEEVRAEAYRNALVLAATVIAPDSDEGRFHVVDRHARRISMNSGTEDAESRLDRVRAIAKNQRKRIEELEAALDFMAGRPGESAWARAYRAAPQRGRSLIGRLLGRRKSR